MWFWAWVLVTGASCLAILCLTEEGENLLLQFSLDLLLVDTSDSTCKRINAMNDAMNENILFAERYKPPFCDWAGLRKVHNWKDTVKFNCTDKAVWYLFFKWCLSISFSEINFLVLEHFNDLFNWLFLAVNSYFISFLTCWIYHTIIL